MCVSSVCYLNDNYLGCLVFEKSFNSFPGTREQVRSFADIRRISAPCLSSTAIGMQAFLRLCLPARPVNSSHYFLGYLFRMQFSRCGNLCWHSPALPGRLQPGTIGRTGLNHRVRDGNGCLPCTHQHQQFLSHLDDSTVKHPLLIPLERR